MKVFLLYRNNHDDYYVKDHELVGVYSSYDRAKAAYEAEDVPQFYGSKKKAPLLSHGTDDPGGNWYTVEECLVDPPGGSIDVQKLLLDMKRYVMHHGLLLGECVAWNKLKGAFGVDEAYEAQNAVAKEQS